MYEKPFNLPKFVFKGFGIALHFFVSGFRPHFSRRLPAKSRDLSVTTYTHAEVTRP